MSASDLAAGVGTASRFALLCYRDDGRTISAEWTYWPTRGEAEQARDVLTPCGPRCIDVHSVVPVNRETDTATIPPASGNSVGSHPRSAPSVRNVS